MAYLLRSVSGDTEYVSIPAVTTATNVWSMYVDFKIDRNGNAQDLDHLLVSSSAGTYSRLILRDHAASKTLTVRTNANNDFDLAGVDFSQRTKFEIESNGTDLILRVNGALHQTLAGAAHTVSNSFDRIGRGASSSVPILDIYEVYFDTGFTQERRYDPSASNGTGSELIDIISAQNGTLTGYPTDGSQWISYAASPSVFVSGPLTPGGTISGTYADYATVPTTLTVSDGTNTITIASPTITDNGDGTGSFSGTMPALPTSGTASLVLFGDVTVELS